MSTLTDGTNAQSFDHHFLHNAILLNNGGVALLQQNKCIGAINKCIGAINTFNDSLRLIDLVLEVGHGHKQTTLVASCCEERRIKMARQRCH
jgi:hypothetical protein